HTSFAVSVFVTHGGTVHLRSEEPAMFDLTAPHFKDEDKAREHLETLRWPNGPVCPHCGGEGGYPIQTARRAGLYKCKKKECRKQFTVTVGTVFERSKIPLTKWLMAT